MAGRVEGKVAFITGAARGQGRSHAIRLAEEGADIIAIDLCEDLPGAPYSGPTDADLDETVKLVQERGGRIVARVADVRDENQLRAAVDEGVSELGRLDIVVANAGIGPHNHRSWEISSERWEETIGINLTGVWHTTKVAIPHILEGGRGGSIVLTSSVGGLKGYQNSSHYVTAKHGIVGLMRALANELAPSSVRVNTLHPTMVDTTMIMNDGLFQSFLPAVENPTREDFAVPCQGMHALPVPWVESIDISNALLFLASDEARYITGITLPIDAGAIGKA
ncbi:mycofactocin-coupled SDR family oxidoreductase [Rhodococcus erythropolis]|uniref:mycofactocin-coupled SDR family oxidoreductase n=1 Tax=Rhodococcus erythropolis TaxID=1833 RepID=UPI00294A6DD3|nr:mycofactocin-coupled SDR family oxidoreductase [Rhodococcus erythropolis]MDV6212765.1 mycofactocin-coupled SDR family oxidoreductase [Rhodococcus erythropolis]